MKNTQLICVVSFMTGMFLLAAGAAQAAELSKPAAASNAAPAAIRKGLDWLAAQQKPNGAWSNDDFPAITALALEAFLRGAHPMKTAIVARATAYLHSCVQPDGGIYRNVKGKGGGMSNYNTAICMAALHATGDPAWLPIVLKARRFVASGQHSGDDPYAGGMGYDAGTGRAYADLSNSWIAYESMRRTQSAEDLRPASEAKVDLDWDSAQRFVARCQNDDTAGKDEAGGFFYRPGESKAATTTNAEGRVVFRAYSSMTYAGLLSLIYAEVKRDDPRVRSAFDWAARHWSLDDNPGMGQQGYYYFVQILAKCLAAYGADTIPAPAGPVVWRTALAVKLASQQKSDPAGGYWVNENARYWENDPVLVTAYVLIALETAGK
ncbi:MAG: prenyltransferase/squalene oxidase repeat-containing protein [bacterium]